MTYVIGAISGTVFGAIIAGLKYLVLWRKFKKNRTNHEDENKAIIARCIISYFINVVTLFVIYILRNVVSEYMNWIAFITASALAVSLLGKLYSVEKIGTGTV